MHKIAQLDHQYVWHPFTQMRDWLKREPILITRGKGAVLQDAHGKEYLDANASIWTNLHGHNHPRINAAINRQLRKIAHSSALGLANEPAGRLAARLVKGAQSQITSELAQNRSALDARAEVGGGPTERLAKVFFSDDGSTALEVAVKLAYEYARRSGLNRNPRFLSLAGGYHGDTLGAVSLGHIDLFHKAYWRLLFPTDSVAAPYCYRCPFNRARPERADAREYRKCNWECLQTVERKFAAARKKRNAYAAFVVEPLIQGAAGMIPQPRGWLAQATSVASAYGALVIADEVMTGFGRTGAPSSQVQNVATALPWFACQQEGVTPDFLALAKGLTGGYLPMAATLTTQSVFDAFLGEYEEFKTFFHGHSYTANQLAAAAALASLEILDSPASLRARARLQTALSAELRQLWSIPQIGDIRQVGLIVGVELVRNWRTREPFDLRERAGIRVCEAMARRGVLTRPIGNVIVIMPPYCTAPAQVRRMVQTLGEAATECFSACGPSKMASISR